MGSTNQVIITDTNQGLASCIATLFEGFGGVGALLKSSRDVYLKVNAVDSQDYCYTNPEVVFETVKYLQAHGARDVYVIENCTQGNFTRLVFKASGILEACRRSGAIPVYLDETGATPVFLEALESFVDISTFVYEKLIMERDKNLYISLPKLKTHSMSQVTLSVKNQFGFVHQLSRVADHNYRIHQKFADLFQIIRPDFVVVDGLIATNHGHYIARANAKECIVPMDCLLGGPDPLAVDVVAAKLMGFDLEDVEHLRLAHEMGLGQGDFSQISIEGMDLFEAKKVNLTCELLDRFPQDVQIIRGTERCCTEGCKRNTETLLEFLYGDFAGKGGFSIVMGQGFDDKTIDGIAGPVHLAGSCAIQECAYRLEKRLGKGKVTQSPGCNNLALSIAGLGRHMKVSPIKMSRASLMDSLVSLVQAKAKGSKANIPPLV